MCKYALNKIKNFNIRNIYQKKIKDTSQFCRYEKYR